MTRTKKRLKTTAVSDLINTIRRYQITNVNLLSPNQNSKTSKFRGAVNANHICTKLV